MTMFNRLKVLVAAGVVALMPMMASAATALIDTGSYTIGNGGDDYEFGGVVTSLADGSGSWTVTFTATTDPLLADAFATIGGINVGEFTDLTVSWVSVATSLVLDSAAILDIGTTLGTVFQSPDDMIQNLVISWSDSTAGFGFDVEVSAVPVPAAGFLLIGALGGLGFVGRRRKKA